MRAARLPLYSAHSCFECASTNYLTPAHVALQGQGGIDIGENPPPSPRLLLLSLQAGLACWDATYAYLWKIGLATASRCQCAY